MTDWENRTRSLCVAAWDNLYDGWLLGKKKLDNNRFFSNFVRWENSKNGKLSVVHAMKVTKQGKWHEEGNLG